MPDDLNNSNGLNRFTKGFLGLLAAVVFILLTVVGNAVYDNVWSPIASEDYGDFASDDTSSCNIIGISLHGTLYDYIPTQGSAEDPNEYIALYGDTVGSQDVVEKLWQAEEDELIKAIVIEVDSGGGQPVAGEEIANTINELTKPVIAVIRQSGMSAAYWAVSSSDRIFASRNSDVGSIGVTSSYLENVEEGTRYIQLSSGKFKDAGDPDKPLNQEEKELLLRDIKITHENFVEDVAKNRKLSVESVKAIADGSSVLGDKAKELGLIDEIGSWTQAKKYIEVTIGEKPELCWL